MLQNTPLSLPSDVTTVPGSVLVHSAQEQGEGAAGEGVIGSDVVRHVSGCWARLSNLDRALPVI